MVKGRSPDMRVHVNAQISHSIPTAINLTISHVYLPHYSVQSPMTFDEVRQRLIHDIHQLVSSSDMADRIRMECLWPDATLRTTDDGLTVIPRNVVRLDQDHRAGQLNGLSIATALNERMNKLLATAVRDDPQLTSLSACVQVVVDRELTLMTSAYYAMIQQNDLSESMDRQVLVSSISGLLAAVCFLIYLISNGHDQLFYIAGCLLTVVLVASAAYRFWLRHQRRRLGQELDQTLAKLRNTISQ